MARLDDLLPKPLTPTALTDLLALPDWQRPAEGLVFEMKSMYEKGLVPKAVAAFANAQGGFLILGAETSQGVLSGLPGLPGDEEWPLRIAHVITSSVSPPPPWKPIVVPVATNPARVVVIVRVEESTRAPHLVGGRIYIRTPGGNSEPLTDRATLDRIYERRGKGTVGDDLAHRDLLPESSMSAVAAITGRDRDDDSWEFGAVAVPIPEDSAPYADLFTTEGFQRLPGLFGGQLLRQPETKIGESEEALVEFGSGAEVHVFESGVMSLRTCRVPQPKKEPLRPRLFIKFLEELLTAQAKRDVHEVHAYLQVVGGEGRRLAPAKLDTLTRIDLSPRSLPDPWDWDGEMPTAGPELERLLAQIENRMWRAAGRIALDP